MKFFYSDTYNIPLPDGHRFPVSKYHLLRNALLTDGTLLEDQLEISPFADISDIAHAHCPSYLNAVLEGALSAKEQRQIGLPWSEHLVRRTLATMGGGIEAARTALQTGFSAQLAGGTHHAHGSFGSGYCVFNDFAIVALKALRERWVDRVAIIDLDVHQGDGNAALLGARTDVFILDVYCEKNFPFQKVTPHLPAPLKPGLSDNAYLSRLSDLLPAVIDFRPGLVLYQGGVDPLCHDALGHLDISYEGLAARDRMVMGLAGKQAFPLASLLAAATQIPSP